MIQKIYSKMFSSLCTKSYHDVTTFEDDGIVEENAKNTISEERTLAFWWNQKIVIIKLYNEKLNFKQLLFFIGGNLQ